MHSGLNTYSIRKINRKYHKPAPTSLTTSYATGDDGYNRNGDVELTDFLTLRYKNVFGNYLRFTDINGKAVVAGTTTYTIDHFTGLAFTNLQSTNTWATHVANALTFTVTVGGQTFSNFYVPNIKELESIRRFDSNWGLDILNLSSSIWTATTDPTNSSNAFNTATACRFTSAAKSANNGCVYFRKHFL